MALTVHIPSQDVTISDNYQVVTHTIVNSDLIYTANNDDGTWNYRTANVTLTAPTGTVALGSGYSFNSGTYSGHVFYVGLNVAGNLVGYESPDVSDTYTFMDVPADDGSSWTFQLPMALFIAGTVSLWNSSVNNYGTVYAIFASL